MKECVKRDNVDVNSSEKTTRYDGDGLEVSLRERLST
jgi:hypothetical protein